MHHFTLISRVTCVVITKKKKKGIVDDYLSFLHNLFSFRLIMAEANDCCMYVIFPDN